jgi:hypothetical protein
LHWRSNRFSDERRTSRTTAGPEIARHKQSLGTSISIEGLGSLAREWAALVHSP